MVESWPITTTRADDVGKRRTKGKQARAPAGGSDQAVFFGTAGQRRRWKVMRVILYVLYAVAGVSITMTLVMTSMGEAELLSSWGAEVRRVLGIEGVHASTWMVTRFPWLFGGTALVLLVMWPRSAMVQVRGDELRVTVGKRTRRYPLAGARMERKRWPGGGERYGWGRATRGAARPVAVIRGKGWVTRLGGLSTTSEAWDLPDDSPWEVPDVSLDGEPFARCIRDLRARGVDLERPTSPTTVAGEPASPRSESGLGAILHKVPGWVMALAIVAIEAALGMILLWSGLVGAQAMPLVALVILATWVVVPRLWR